MLKPGDQAPDFDLPSAVAGRATRTKLRDIKTELVVLFFYPHDFSFVCPTEVAGFNHALAEFQAEQSAVLGASVDSVDSHIRWAEELGGIGYPLLADEGGKLASAFGVLDDREHVALRATFILDPKRVVTYALASPINVGRSIPETLRVVRAIRTGRLCPADWEPGVAFGPNELKY
jgi:alkyl hydroperoxide reductase subunit AhpC